MFYKLINVSGTVDKSLMFSAELLEQLNDWLISIGLSESWASRIDNFLILLVIIAVAYLANLILNHVILEFVSKLVKTTKATWDDIVFDKRVMAYISHLIAPIIIYIAIPIAYPEDNDSILLDFFQRICLIYIIAILLRFVGVFLTAVYNVYSHKKHFRDKPLKGLLQIMHVILFFIGGIVIIAILLDKSPMVLLTGLGASAAVLMLVFKDTIMGFVSGIQLTINDMLHVGDWITMPKYGADGTVFEVTLNTVKIRNFDNTIVTIPPYLLVSDSFQNWQGMSKSGGRRIKRFINIDMQTIAFCDKELINKFKENVLLKDYFETHISEEEMQSLTNIGIFRIYLKRYLEHQSFVNKNLTYMIRELQPTENGMPLELYFFSSIKDWVPYEEIQSNVMDHVLAVIPQFNLRVFQNPTGTDLQRILKN